MLFVRANPIKQDNSVDNLTSLQALGTLSCAALNRPPLIHTQRVVQTLSIERVTPCQSLELLGILLQENNSIHYFYCQTGRMLAWELPAFLDKGKDMWVA